MKSLKRCRGQKVNRLPTFGVENEHQPDEEPQYFQVSIRVLESQKLVWPNKHAMNSFVMIVLGRKKYCTTVRRNTKEPFYNECFVYEMYGSTQGLQRTCLWLAVMEPRWCARSRIIGEAFINLGAVWDQLNHQIHKWVQLILPSDSSASPVGFLNVEISIIVRGDIQIVSGNEDKQPAENHLLLPSVVEQQRVNYMITVYRAFTISSSNQCYGHRRHGKLLNTFVRVKHCGLVAKTGVQPRNSNPIYSEHISLTETFPNVCGIIRFEVCSVDGAFNRCIGGVQLKLGWISYDGENGFLPTFGPSLLHMYCSSKSELTTNEDGPYHRGALLVSLRTTVPYCQKNVRYITVEPATLTKPESSWLVENFCIYCSVLEVSMLDQKIFSKSSGIALTMAEIDIVSKQDTEFDAMNTELKKRKLHYTGPMNIMKSSSKYGFLDFTNRFPVLQLAIRLPDVRFRMYRKNLIKRIVVNMESSVSNVEQQLSKCEYDCLSSLFNVLDTASDAAIAGIEKLLNNIEFSNTSNDMDDMIYSSQHSNWTELDQKQHEFLKYEMAKIRQELIKRRKQGSMCHLDPKVTMKMNENKKGLKMYLSDMKEIVKKLKSLLFKNPDGWPDIVIWLLNGGSRVAYARVRAIDIIYSVIPEQSGTECSQLQTFLFKPIKCQKDCNCNISDCSCVVGKVELLLWMSVYRHMAAFENYLPNGFKLRSRNLEMSLHAELLMLQCRVFLSKARLINYVQSDCTSLFLRANALNSVKDSKLTQKSKIFVWNQILKIQKLMFMSQERVMNVPPTVILELIEMDLMGNEAVIGRFQTTPLVSDSTAYENAPTLQWYDIYRGSIICGQVLTSVQLLLMPEKTLRATNYLSEDSIYSGEVKYDDTSENEVESLPTQLVPDPKTYKIDIYWWGLRNITITRKPCVILEVNDLTIKSDIVCKKMPNCNFPNGRMSHIFESTSKSLKSLRVMLCDSGTFGRTLPMGASAAKSLNKYIVNWITQNERESSLKSASIISSQFSQVSQKSYVKKSELSIKLSEDIFIQSPMTNMEDYQAKQNLWSKLLCKKRPTEEQFVLLPVVGVQKEKEMLIKKYERLNETGSWWSRYYSSTKQLQEDKNGNNLPVSSGIKIYNFELELQPEFSKFKDWCFLLKFYSGDKSGITNRDEQLFCGFLKAGIAIYEWPPQGDTIAVAANGVKLKNGYFDDFPYNERAQFIVRVYLVKAIDVTTKKLNGKSDPYIILSCGEKIVGDSRSLAVNNLFPIFGRMFEFRCTFPDDYLLQISLFEHNFTKIDEMIGCTSIDLEDRAYTKHRARVGISSEYTVNGRNKWRDCMKPSEILEELCKKNHLPSPAYPIAGCVVVNGVEYRDSDKDALIFSLYERKEKLCLSLLHQWHTLRVCGYHLVPEHVETRSLFSPEKPEFEQGKIQMWVDIFPMDTEQYIPAPVDITPPSAEDFELRLIVWEVQQLRLDSSAYRSYPDIFVRIWLGATSQAQNTDVLYGCTKNGGQFNWRMIFNFRYLFVENKVIVETLEPFIEYTDKFPPFLTIQLLELSTKNGLGDNIIGTLVLNLNDLPRGRTEARSCSIVALDCTENVNLFSTRTIRGWWPLWTIDEENEKKVLAGVIDLEMNLLSKKEALLNFVGIGRSPPSPLPVPQRSKKSVQFNIEEKCRRGLKLSLAVLLIFTFSIFIIYFDVLSTFETTEQMRELPGLRKLIEND